MTKSAPVKSWRLKRSGNKLSTPAMWLYMYDNDCMNNPQRITLGEVPPCTYAKFR